MVTPRFHRASERLYPLRQRGQPVLRLLLPATPVIAGFPALKTNSVLAFPCLLSSGATRLVPRFFPTGASIKRCQEFRTFGAPPRAPGLGLGSFSLVGIPRRYAVRLASVGIPTRLPPHTSRLGRVQAPFHRGPTDSIQLSRFVRAIGSIPPSRVSYQLFYRFSPQVFEVVHANWRIAPSSGHTLKY